MSKFKAGDVVVCVNDFEVFDLLCKGQAYTVDESLKNGEQNYLRVHGIHGWIMLESRFEPFEEWAKHQKPVSPDVELELARIQIKMLQDGFKKYRQEAKYLLRHYNSNLRFDSSSLRIEIAYFLEHDKLEVIKHKED